MTVPVTVGNKIGVKRGIINRHERTFHRGSLMFIEGESSAEMFIVRSGKVRILKQEGGSTVELAILGPGSVIGELALLDHQPRSATAQVLEDTVVTVIDEELFTRTLQRIPPWLGNIVQLVVRRLRDTMKKTSDDVVNKSIAGVIRVILLLNENEGKEILGQRALPLNRVKEAIYAAIGLGGIESENVFLHLILKEMVLINRNDCGQEYLVLKDTEVMLLYMNYLRTRQVNGFLPGENLSGAAFNLAKLILEAGERSGKKEGDRLMRIGLPQVELELERQGDGRYIDQDALDELVSAKLLIKHEDVTESTYGKHKRIVLLYNAEVLKRIYLLKIWLPVFKEEIRF